MKHQQRNMPAGGTSTMSTNIIVTAVTATIALIAGCAVQSNEDSDETMEDPNQMDIIQASGRCANVPEPVLTNWFHYPGGLGGWAGTHGSATDYGDTCTPYYVIETTRAYGVAGLELSAYGVADSTMNASPVTCTSSSITVEAWGCISFDFIGGACSQWAYLGETTNSGVWTPGTTVGDWTFPSICDLSASRPSTPSNSPYRMLRLGATASKTAFVNGTLTRVPVPIDEHIGFYVVN
jgi:hypothetical protein